MGPGKMQAYQKVPKFHGQPSEKVHLSIIFIYGKDLAFSVIIGQVKGFPSEHTVVHHLYNTSSDRNNLGSSIFHLKRSFTFHLIL